MVAYHVSLLTSVLQVIMSTVRPQKCINPATSTIVAATQKMTNRAPRKLKITMIAYREGLNKIGGKCDLFRIRDMTDIASNSVLKPEGRGRPR